MSVLVMSSDADPFRAAETLTRPSAVLWDGVRTFVQIEGHPDDVRSERGLLASQGSWVETVEWPELPPYRWSLAPRDLRSLDRTKLGPFVASIGVGTVLADVPQPRAPASAALLHLHARVKHQFDPAGRLNPGRDAMRRAS
jgi:hypothetical protein